jgi:hypothetical protein
MMPKQKIEVHLEEKEIEDAEKAAALLSKEYNLDISRSAFCRKAIVKVAREVIAKYERTE